MATYLRCDNTFNHDFVTDIRQNFNAKFFSEKFWSASGEVKGKNRPTVQKTRDFHIPSDF